MKTPPDIKAPTSTLQHPENLQDPISKVQRKTMGQGDAGFAGWRDVWRLMLLWILELGAWSFCGLFTALLLQGCATAPERKTDLVSNDSPGYFEVLRSDFNTTKIH